ncbi:MAG: RNase adapter RapZ [Gammaproteobacteria bacterium]|jgi:RNase adapter protein RapZ|nr:RNase adapter RapZ [Gammaproteobacteria bacterium]
MKLVIISGLSGSGKSVALHTLEDEGYYCVDNLPLGLLPGFIEQLSGKQMRIYNEVAVGIDARSGVEELMRFNEILNDIRTKNIDVEVIYFQADINTLIKRYNDTRRRHPLAKRGIPLAEAIELEQTLISPIALTADLCLDTTRTNIHQLRSLLKERVLLKPAHEMSLLIQSFGFKNGSPSDSDFVFDLRCLPNPHWEPALRELTGQDPEVRRYLDSRQESIDMYNQLLQFLETWIPQFNAQNRYYLTISVGCTGGQHRSVYMAEKLSAALRNKFPHVSLRHRELE